MNKKLTHKYVLFIIFIMTCPFFVQSCNDTSSCNTAQNRSIKASFQSIDNNQKLIDATLTYVFFIGSNGGKIPYSDASKVSLGINIQSDTTTYIIKPDSSSKSLVYDTVQFIFKSELVLESVSCGYNYSYTIKKGSYTTYLLDSIKIVNSKIAFDINPNLLFILKDTASQTSILKNF
jgi:hypothetical protein